MRGFRQKLRDELKAVDAKVDVQANLSLDLTQAHAQLNAFRAFAAANPLRMRVDLDTAGAHAQLAALAAHMLALNAANSTSITITGIGSAASSALNPVTLLAGGLVALGAVSLIPLVGQLAQAAGVLALIPAAASAAVVGIGTLVVGLSGIKNAFDAVKKASEDNGKSAAAAQKKIDSAIRGTATAQKGLASAQKQASRTAVDGQRQIAGAQKTYNQALKREQDAQKDLSRARKDAAKQLEDLGRQLRGGVLDERDAELAVREAKQRLAELGQDGPVTQIEVERAVLGVDQAQNQLEETRARNRELRDESGKSAKAGVEGSELVQDAQERVAEAAENTKDAEQNLARTREDVTQANIDAQDRIVEAQQRVVESQEALNDAISEGDTVAKELEDALSKLAPSARDFVTKVQTLGSAWTDFRKNVQEKLFFGLGDSVVDLGNSFLPMLKSDIGDIAAEINGGLKRAFQDLASDENVSTFGKIFENVRQSIGPLIDGLNDMFVAFLNLSGVGSEFLPGLSTGFAGSMEDFRKWTEDPANQGKFRTFIEEALRTFGVLAEIVKEIGEIGWNLFAASDETGESMIDGILKKLIEFSDWVKSPEGQKSIKEFFEDVKNLVVEIGTAIEKTLGLLKEVNDADLGGLGKRVGGLGKSAGENAGKDFTTGGPVFSKVADPLLEKFTGVPTEAGKNYIFSKQFFKDAAVDYAQWGIDMKTTTGEIWSSISGTIGTWVTDIKDNAFEDFKSGLTGVQTFFSENVPKVGAFFGDLKTNIGLAVDGIETVWGRLAGIIEGPINAVKTILDEFGKLWDKVADALGLDPWFKIGGPDSVSVIPGSGPQSFGKKATGGPIYGAGGPTEDKIPGWLSNNEHVWTAAEVKAAGGHGAVEELRKTVLAQGANPGNYRMGGPIRGFAVGGGVEFGSDADIWMSEVVQKAFADATITSAYRPGHSGFHGKAQAVDIASPNMQAIADWIYQAYPDSEQLIWGPGPLLYNVGGTSITDQDQLANQVYAGDLAGHFNHIHWANDTPLGAGAFAGQDTTGQAGAKPGQDNSIYGRISRGAGNIASNAKNAVANKAIGLFESGARGLVGKIPSFDNLGEFGKIPQAFGNKMVDSLVGYLRSKAGVGKPGVSVQAGKQNYILDGGVEQWRPLVEKLFAEKGIDPALTDKYLYQIQRESSGNPNAINNEDSNAKKGTPSKGLAQVIDPTFEAFKDPGYDDIYDPESNLRASLNYLLQDPKFGGRGVDALTGSGYDQGGEAVGVGLMPKKILEPERVLDPKQTSDFNELVRILGLPQFLDSLKLAPLAIQNGAEAKSLEQQIVPQTTDPSYSAPVGRLDEGTNGASSTPGSIFNLFGSGQLPWYLTGENAGTNLAGQASALATSQVQGLESYVRGNWREMLDTALGAAGMGAANSGGAGMTIHGNVGYSPKQLTDVYNRTINRQVRAARFNTRGMR